MLDCSLFFGIEGGAIDAVSEGPFDYSLILPFIPPIPDIPPAGLPLLF